MNSGRNSSRAGQFLFHVAYDGGGIAGNDQFLVLDLVGDAAFFNKHAHIIAGELACRPGGEYGQSLGVFDKQPGRHLAGFDFTGYDEVGQGKVGGHQHPCVLVRVVDRVDAFGNGHGPLRVGEDVEAFEQQREQGLTGEVGHYHDSAILGHVHGTQHGLGVQIGGHFTGKNDGGEAHGPVAVLQGSASEGDHVLVGLFGVS